MRLPVQWVNRPHSHFRGYAGLLCSGSVRPGDAVVALPSGKQAQVKSIVAWHGDLAIAEAGTSVTVTLDRELDISRGDVLCAANAPCAVSDQFEIDLIWLAEAALLPGRLYLIKSASKTVNGRISALKSVLNIQNGEIPQTQVAARTLQLNDIALANLILDEPIAFAPYAEDRTLGSLILIDRQSNATVGMGMIRFAQRRADNLKWQQLSVDKAARASLTRQKPSVLWFTGLSGAGKSTIANLLEQRLHARGHLTYLLDGDNVRHGLNKDLGFTDAARVENIRRVAEVAKLMADAGLMVLVAFISPFRAERAMARELLEPGEFIEIFVDAPLAVVEARDPKGLYAKARRGEIKHFTGISSTYEAPEHPELRIDTTQASAEAAAMQIDAWLQAQGRCGCG
jgi:bifunctional enzyme CysN/CysC